MTLALPDPELVGTDAPNAAFSVDVPLMPEGWSESPVDNRPFRWQTRD